MFIYLWYVRKTWVDNAINKFAMPENRVPVLFALGEIMYSCGCIIGINVILWAKQQIHLLATRYPNATCFMKCLTKH